MTTTIWNREVATRVHNQQLVHRNPPQSAGKIVRNRPRSSAHSVSTPSDQLRVLKFNETHHNFTRPQLRGEFTFLDSYSNIKKTYSQIDKYCQQKISSREQSSQRHRPRGIRKNKPATNHLTQSKQHLDEKQNRNRYQSKNSSPKGQHRIQVLKQLKGKSSLGVMIRQFKHHINLEGKLRNLKHKITHRNLKQIRQILTCRMGVPQQKYHLTSEQFDPFMVDEGNEDSQSLSHQIKRHIQQTELNWQQKLSRRFPEDQVASMFQKLDFDKQQQLSLKVFVRETSMVLNLNLRKRDLFSVFERLRIGCLITRESFLQALSFS